MGAEGVLQTPGIPQSERWSVQISRFLVVDPRQRYTAGEALAHPFFQQYDVEEVRHFSPFRKFKVGMSWELQEPAVAWVFQLGVGFGRV